MYRRSFQPLIIHPKALAGLDITSVPAAQPAALILQPLPWHLEAFMTKLLFDHFVVSMLENRLFDHLFGYLGIGDGLSKKGGINYLKPGDKTSGTFKSSMGGDYTAIGQGPVAQPQADQRATVRRHQADRGGCRRDATAERLRLVFQNGPRL
jgi:phospholipase C